MTQQLTAAQVRRARWHSLALGAERVASAPDVVDRLGALQGQDLPGVLLSIALRVDSADLGDVRASFNDGTLVRGWPMRGTLHALRAHDLLPLTQITQKRMRRSMAGRAGALGLTDQVIESVNHAVVNELSESGAITRAELREMVLRAHRDEPSRDVISHLIYQLAVRGLICHGPFRESQQLIVHTESWVGPSTVSNHDDFLARMLERYVVGHGPVSEADAARWFALPLSTIRGARAALGHALIDVDTPTGAQWMATGLQAERILSMCDRRPGVRLLPGFDEFMLGYADRSFAVPAEFVKAIVPGGNGMFRATVCSGASVIGTWLQGPRGEALQIHEFAPISSRTASGIRSAAREISRITGKRVSVQLPPLV